MQNYELMGVVGQGQYGVAHKAKNKGDGQLYCLKRIPMTAKDDQRGALAEAQLLSSLDHVNIIGYKESFMDKDQSLCIVTYFCEEGDLFHKIRRRASSKEFFSEDEIMDMFIQIASALQYIHSKKVLHRDLKTQNIFIARGGIMKLGDFGISKVLEKTDSFANTLTGTPYCMAPEICTNQPYTFKSDIWALGCVLYEMCTLRHAFAADSLLSLVYQIVRGNFPPIPSDVFSADMSALVNSLLVREASERPNLTQIFQMPYVKACLERYQVQGRLAMSRRTGTMGRRISGALGSSMRRMDTVYANAYQDDSNLTPKEKIARKKEEESQRRAMELKVASLNVHKDRADASGRKTRMVYESNIIGLSNHSAVPPPDDSPNFGTMSGSVMGRASVSVPRAAASTTSRRMPQPAGYTTDYPPEEEINLDTMPAGRTLLQQTASTATNGALQQTASAVFYQQQQHAGNGNSTQHYGATMSSPHPPMHDTASHARYQPQEQQQYRQHQPNSHDERPATSAATARRNGQVAGGTAGRSQSNAYDERPLPRPGTSPHTLRGGYASAGGADSGHAHVNGFGASNSEGGHLQHGAANPNHRSYSSQQAAHDDESVLMGTVQAVDVYGQTVSTGQTMASAGAAALAASNGRGHSNGHHAGANVNPMMSSTVMMGTLNLGQAGMMPGDGTASRGSQMQHSTASAAAYQQQYQLELASHVPVNIGHSYDDMPVSRSGARPGASTPTLQQPMSPSPQASAANIRFGITSDSRPSGSFDFAQHNGAHEPHTPQMAAQRQYLTTQQQQYAAQQQQQQQSTMQQDFSPQQCSPQAQGRSQYFVPPSQCHQAATAHADEHDEEYEDDFESEEVEVQAERAKIINNMHDLANSSEKADTPSGADSVKEKLSTLTKSSKSQALRTRAETALGASFPAVYAYLKRARASGSADEREVQRQLLQLMGGDRSRMPGCFIVDQLVFLDQNYV